MVSMRLTEKCRPDVAQEVDVVERREPLGIVDHDGVGLARAEFEELGEGLLHALLVGLDLLEREDLARLVLARRVAHARRAAAHQHDRLAAALLQPMQHHDGDEAAHVQRRRRAVVADVGGDRALGAERIEARLIGALVHETALGEDL